MIFEMVLIAKEKMDVTSRLESLYRNFLYHDNKHLLGPTLAPPELDR